MGGKPPSLVALASLEETLAFGEFLGKGLEPQDVLGMVGPLGVGKTTMVQGIAKGLGIDPGFQVTSPTFVYMQIYGGPTPLYHVDLYRIENEKKLVTSGLMDTIGEEGVSVIEWYDRFPQIWEQPFMKMSLDFGPEGSRQIHIETESPRARKILEDWERES